MAFRFRGFPSQTALVAAVLLPSLLPLLAQRPAPPPSGRPGTGGVGRGSLDRPGPVERPRPGGERGPGFQRGRGVRPGERSGPVNRIRPNQEKKRPLRFNELLATPRCTERPDETFWRTRDLAAEIQRNARRGPIPIVRIAPDASEVKGFGLFPAGWRGYGFVVPPGESLKVSLFHPNRGWFRLQMVNKWGNLEEGMLQNVVRTFEPVVTYTNPSKQARAIYVIADDPGWMSYEQNPFTLKIERSWDPALKLDDTPVVQGIWTAAAEEAPKPEAEAKKG